MFYAMSSAIAVWRGLTRAQRIATVVTIALVLAWMIYATTRPLGDDAYIFEWAARTITHGGVMYRDAWELKGPFVFYVVAGLRLIAGPSAVAYRVFDLLVQISGAAIVFAIVRRLGASLRIAVFAALLQFLWYANLGFQDSAQPDGWIATMIAGSVLAALARPRRLHAECVLGGFLIGCSTLFKPFYAGFLVVPALLLLRSRTREARVGSIVALLVGAIVPVLAAVLYFRANGALSDAIEVYLRYTAAVYAQIDSVAWTSRLGAYVDELLHRPIALVLPFALWGIVRAVRVDRLIGAAIALWCLGGAAVLILQGRFFAPYQWFAHFAPLTVATALGLQGLGVTRDSLHERDFRTFAMALVLVAFALSPLVDLARYAKHLVLRTPSAEFEHDNYDHWARSPDSFHSLARYVTRHTSPADRVLIVGNIGGVYALIDRTPLTRFSMAQAWFDGDGTDFQRRYRQELLAAATAHPPALIVTADSSCGSNCQPWRFRLTKFPELDTLLQRHYVRDTVIAQRRVWRRVVSPATLTSASR